MPKLPCCTKASFYAKSAFLLLKASLYANCFCTNYPREVYTHNAAVGKDYTKGNFYAKRSNDLGLPHIGFMTGSYPHPCIGNNGLLSFLRQNFVLLGSPLDYSRDIPMRFKCHPRP